MRNQISRNFNCANEKDVALVKKMEATTLEESKVLVPKTDKINGFIYYRIYYRIIVGSVCGAINLRLSSQASAAGSYPIAQCPFGMDDVGLGRISNLGVCSC